MATVLERELISQREYARRRGISNVSVHRAVVSGRISTVDGKIDPAVADREWAENTDPGKPRNRITGSPKHTRSSGEPPQPMPLASADGSAGGAIITTGYARARAARELYQAQLLKLDLEERDKTLVRADMVRIAAFNMARKTRDQLIALPERLATILAATTDPTEVQRILEDETERICEELSDAERS